MLDLADVFFCNEVELDMALRFLSYGDPVQLLDHCGAVLVTRGAKGATWYDGSHARNVPAKPVDVVDPTGAGDCLRAGWYAAKHAGLDDQTALEHGVRAGSFAVGHPGPQERIMSRADLGL